MLGVFWGPEDLFWAAIRVIFLVLGGLGSENDRKLENDDLLKQFAMLLGTQGLQHETKMVPKRTKIPSKST